jgi:phosphoadenosine phosphosulfate reductase
MIDTLNKHERIALQFSGGRDSLACLYLLRDFLDRITVYWLNTGDAFPETLQMMEQLKPMIPHFVEIDGNRAAVVAEHGLPTDILPRSSTPIGLASRQSRVRMQDSYSCCLRTVMLPMHARMIEDGITLVIRGQRADDSHRAPINSGDVDAGIEYLFPIERWSADDVDRYLVSAGAPIPRFYDCMDTTPPCLHCTGWWGEGRGKYLRKYHPEAFASYQQALNIIATETAPHIAHFNTEIAEGNEP